MTVTICRDADDLAAHAADLIIYSASEAIAERGRFTIALSGGRTPAKIYEILAQPDRSNRIAWDKTFVFVSDERVVPIASADSNFGNAQRALLDKIPIPRSNLFAPDVAAATASATAAGYERQIAAFFGRTADEPCPSFDLILLGLGDDGHTASLFPGMPTLDETKAWVLATPPGVLPPPVDRVTFTFPLLNAARRVAFLVSGQGKAAVLHDLFDGSPSVSERPAAGIKPVRGELLWIVDEAASRLLTGGVY